MPQFLKDFLIDQAKAWLFECLSSYTGWLAFAGIALMATMFASIILGKLAKYVPAMMITAAVFMGVAWWQWPRTQTVVETKVVHKTTTPLIDARAAGDEIRKAADAAAGSLARGVLSIASSTAAGIRDFAERFKAKIPTREELEARAERLRLAQAERDRIAKADQYRKAKDEHERRKANRRAALQRQKQQYDDFVAELGKAGREQIDRYNTEEGVKREKAIGSLLQPTAPPQPGPVIIRRR